MSMTIDPSEYEGDVKVLIELTVKGNSGDVNWSVSPSTEPPMATIVSEVPDHVKAHIIPMRPGVITITATDTSANTATCTICAGTLLIYGDDGNCYVVKANTWTATPATDGDKSAIPSLSSMQAESQIAVFVPQQSAATSFTTCYVLNLSGTPRILPPILDSYLRR